MVGQGLALEVEVRHTENDSNHYGSTVSQTFRLENRKPCAGLPETKYHGKSLLATTVGHN